MLKSHKPQDYCTKHRFKEVCLKITLISKLIYPKLRRLFSLVSFKWGMVELKYEDAVKRDNL